MVEEPPSVESGLHRLAPLYPILGGVLLLVALATMLHEPVEIAGDGALKQFILQSWIDTDEVTSEVRWSPPEPWVEDLWQEFHFPFEVPFVYEGKVVSAFFLLLTLPLLQLFGYAGLFVLPALSMVGLWCLIAWNLERSGVRGYPSALALLILVLSPLTFFGMMFWEHVPGLLAFFGGMTLLTRQDAKPTGDTVGGFLLALSVMLRPELVIAAAVMFLGSLIKAPRHVGAIPGTAIGLLVWVSINLWVTGYPLGIHAQQPLYLSGGDVFPKLIAYFQEMLTTMTFGASAAVCALAIGGPLVWRRREDENRYALLLLMVAVVATLVVLPAMIPYSGEYLGFRRFELLLIPAGALIAGHLIGKYRWAPGLFALLCLLQLPSFVQQIERFHWANGDRLFPVIKAIESQEPSALIADSQFTAIELSSQMRRTPLVWAPPPLELTRLIGEVARHTDLDQVALVFWKPGPSSSLTIPVEGHGPIQWVRLAGDDEGFALFMPQ